MFLLDKLTGKKIWKYHLADESLAAASAGMSATTGLDQRCIIFTIHLTSEAGHPPLCRALFDTVETYFIEKKLKRRSASYSGLKSFIDVNGSKFSGADRDKTKAHCHGSIFIPWNTSVNDAKALVTHLEIAACKVWHDGQFVVKNHPSAVDFKIFDPSRSAANLVTWTEYAQKETTRVTSENVNMIFLPFDIRKNFDAKTSRQIEMKRDKTLQVLRSRERFKVLSYL